MLNFYYYGWQKQGIGYIDQLSIQKNREWARDYKVYISKAYGMGKSFPTQVINQPILGENNSCCTETYLLIGPFKVLTEAQNVISYMKTRFLGF